MGYDCVRHGFPVTIAVLSGCHTFGGLRFNRLRALIFAACLLFPAGFRRPPPPRGASRPPFETSCGLHIVHAADKITYSILTSVFGVGCQPLALMLLHPGRRISRSSSIAPNSGPAVHKRIPPCRGGRARSGRAFWLISSTRSSCPIHKGPAVGGTPFQITLWISFAFSTRRVGHYACSRRRVPGCPLF